MEKAHEMVTVPFTDAEFFEMANKLARACVDINRVQARKKKAADAFKARLSGLEDIRDQASEQLKAGGVTQMMECDIERLHAEGVARLYVEGQLVKERPLSGEELQQPGVFDGTNPGPPIIDDGLEVFCDACGAQVEVDDEYCTECGADLAPDGGDPPSQV